MRNLFLILATVAAVTSVGCDSSEKYASSSRVEWQFEIDRLDRASASTNADVATVKAEIAEIKLAIREIPKVIKPAKAERTTLCSLAIQSGTNDTLDYDDEPETVVEPEVVAAPVQTYSGPKTYSAARTTGYKTIQKTRKVAKTVYEDEPYEVKVPVAVRDVYQTVQEQVPVSVTKTRMRTETRQRTKTVMVPQQVTEDYTVSVPETYTETVMTTRSKRVKVDTEEVAIAAAPAPVSAPVTYAAAPVSCVDCVECTDCVQAPAVTMPYVSAPIATPATFYNVSQTVAAPVYAAPSQLMASIPVSVATTRQPRMRPLATAARAYSTVRRQNQVNRCSNGQCNLN